MDLETGQERLLSPQLSVEEPRENCPLVLAAESNSTKATFALAPSKEYESGVSLRDEKGNKFCITPGYTSGITITLASLFRQETSKRRNEKLLFSCIQVKRVCSGDQTNRIYAGEKLL